VSMRRPRGQLRNLELLFTAETRATVETAFRNDSNRIIVDMISLPSCEDESIAVCYSYDRWDNKDLLIPGDGKVSDLRFSTRDPENTGRPIRLEFGPIPKDGDALIVTELGGYALPSPTAVVQSELSLVGL
jgi:hypothetical protein